MLPCSRLCCRRTLRDPSARDHSAKAGPQMPRSAASADGKRGRPNRTGASDDRAVKMDVAYASATSILPTSALDLTGRRALSPVEVTRLILDRLDALQPRDQRVLRRRSRRGAGGGARIRGALAAAASRSGRLDGVPVTIKDLILMRGFPTLRGSRLVDPRSGLVGGRAGDGAAARGGRGHPRQDDDAGIRLEGVGRQPADRDHPQPVGPRRAPRAAAAPAPRRPAPPASGRCMSAATAPARSASRAPSPASSGSSRALAGCRPIRRRRWACCRMSGRWPETSRMRR